MYKRESLEALLRVEYEPEDGAGGGDGGRGRRRARVTTRATRLYE